MYRFECVCFDSKHEYFGNALVYILRVFIWCRYNCFASGPVRVSLFTFGRYVFYCWVFVLI